MADDMVVVPPRVGRLRHPTREGAHDDVDDLLGPATAGGPGPVDAVLVATGAALSASPWLLDAPDGVGWAGAAVLLLGLALPTRSLLQRIRRGGRGALRLDAGDPWVAELVTAHDRVVDGVADATSDVGRDVLTAAHLAVVEVASLLQGRATAGPAEREYCAARTRGLDRLAVELAPDPATGVRTPEPEEARRREAVADALCELERDTGVSSLARLDALTQELHRA